MKTNFSRSALTAALTLALGAIAGPAPASAQSDLRSYLVGEWREVVRSPVGTVDVIVLSLRPDGTFRTTIGINGNFRDPAWQAGTWGVRGNQLLIHNQAWYPMRNVNPRGGPGAQTWNKVDVNIQPYQSWGIRVIDNNHFTGDTGVVATRMGR